MNIIFDGIFNEENLNLGYAKIIEVNKSTARITHTTKIIFRLFVFSF